MFCYAICKVFTKDINKTGCSRATCHALRHAIIELIRQVTFIFYILIVLFTSYGFCYIFKIKLRLAFSKEQSIYLFTFLRIKRSQINIVRSLHLYIINKRQHTETLVCRMRICTSWTAWLHSATPHSLTLTLQWSLEIQSPFKVSNLLFVKSLNLAYLIKFFFIMFFAVCISIANPHSNTSFTIQLIKIVTKEFTTCLFHFI